MHLAAGQIEYTKDEKARASGGRADGVVMSIEVPTEREKFSEEELGKDGRVRVGTRTQAGRLT